MNRGWQRFWILFPTAFIAVTQLQPARAGFGIGGFEIPTSPADDYGKAAAAASSGSATASNHFGVVQKDSQKVAVCVLGVCVDVPNIPILNPKAPSQNQPTPTISLEQPSNTEQETPLASDNEKPTTDLTGTWIWRGTPFSIHKGGCTAGYTGELTFNGQNADQGVEITVTQKNNQVLIPGTAVAYSPGLSQRYTESSQGTISGNRFSFRTLGNPSFADSTIDHIGTVSNDGNTITGESFCKSSSGSATAKGTFTWTRKVSLAQCPRFKTMLSEAQELQKIADTLEKNDKAYHTAAIDIILRGYRSPYAVYMLDIPSKEIPEFFRDEGQIRAVRSQIIDRIRTKASNRERFAKFGQSGNFHTNGDVYSKENIELFCTLDSSKFTKEFWDSLWMAGYIDYDLYKETETKIIIVSHKDYFENLSEVATSLLIPVEKPILFIAGYASKAFKGFSLTKLGIKNIQALKARELPRAAIEEIGLFSKAEAAANSMAALSRATLPAGESFATIIHIGALTEKIGIVSAETANAEIVRTLGGKPPFLEGTNVTRYKVGEKGLNLVRFWGGSTERGGSKEIGYYLTFESEVIDARSDAVALRDALALPPGNTMEHVSVIKVKPGAEIEAGYVSGNFGLDGGGIQVRIMNKNVEQFTTVLKRIQ